MQLNARGARLRRAWQGFWSAAGYCRVSCGESEVTHGLPAVCGVGEWRRSAPQLVLFGVKCAAWREGAGESRWRRWRRSAQLRTDGLSADVWSYLVPRRRLRNQPRCRSNHPTGCGCEVRRHASGHSARGQSWVCRSFNRARHEFAKAPKAPAVGTPRTFPSRMNRSSTSRQRERGMTTGFCRHRHRLAHVTGATNRPQGSA